MLIDNKKMLLPIMVLILIVNIFVINLFSQIPVILSVISIFTSLIILGLLINNIVNKKIPFKNIINYLYLYLIILCIIDLNFSLNTIENNKINKELGISQIKEKIAESTQAPTVTPIPTPTPENIVYTDRFSKDSKYILITQNTTIYSKSNLTQSIGNAKVNDIFEIENKTGNIYKIFLFAGEYRYIKIKNPKIIKFDKSSLPDIELQKELFKELVLAQDCSHYFSEKLALDTKYQRYLSDMFQLEIIRKYSLNYNPLVFKKISANGIDLNWNMGLYNDNVNLCGKFSI